MTITRINTVTGAITPDQLGTTLMHEHIVIGYPGWESDTLHPGPSLNECLAIAVDRIQQMQDHGINSMLDPCPSDLGRDVELAAEVASRTGFNIVCATGFYKEDQGGKPYWALYHEMGQAAERMAEVMIHEFDHGISGTGIKPGVIKVGSGVGRITDYEYGILKAASIAHKETGLPVTTHTDQGTMGIEQQQYLVENGVPAHMIIIGHSCGNPDVAYHQAIAGAGSYVGFDRFGLDILAPDSVRIDNLVRMIEGGWNERLVVSHDCVFCARGVPFPEALVGAADLDVLFNPTHFHRHIIPQLKSRGITDEQLDMLLIENPRRYFSGAPLSPVHGG